jgi:Transposase IS66 family/Transposase/IS66 Orf2 like protein
MSDRFDDRVGPGLGSKADAALDGAIRGIGRRRRWSRDDQARIVSESLKPGANVSEVERPHGLNPPQLIGEIKVLVAMQPVDFRKQADSLAALVQEALFDNPYSGAIYVFQPLHNHPVGLLKASPKLFCDETRCPVLDPGRGKTKTGYLVVDRPRPTRRAAAASTRSSCSPASAASCRSTAYSVCKQLTLPTRAGGAVTLAYCWSHLRRKFYEVYVGGHAPVATEALARIKLLYEIEADIRGFLSPPVIPAGFALSGAIDHNAAITNFCTGVLRVRPKPYGCISCVVPLAK